MELHGGHKKYDAKPESTKAEGGTAKSNGDQDSDSGHNKSDVEANTTAYQENWLAVEQGKKCTPALAAKAATTTRRKVGDVHIKASIDSVNLKDVLNDSQIRYRRFRACLSDGSEALINLPRSLCQAGLFFGWFFRRARPTRHCTLIPARSTPQPFNVSITSR